MATRRSDVEILARAFLDEFGVDWIANFDSVLQGLGLVVGEVVGVSFDGALVRVAGVGRGRIAVRSDIRELGRKRFTIAHEMGHYVLPNHAQEPSLCRSDEVQSWGPRLRARERDANAFAAEILFPREVVIPLASREPSFSTVSDLASMRGASLTASAVRYVELSVRRLALVYSHEGHVVWYRTSEEFGRGIPRGRIGQRTVAGRIFGGEKSFDSFEEVSAADWLYDVNLLEDATILEWSRALPSYKAVLTLLYIEDPVEARSSDTEEDGEDISLAPEEFTLDRRRWPGKSRRR
jgi:IrrE N-terminal-like domain